MKIIKIIIFLYYTTILPQNFTLPDSLNYDEELTKYLQNLAVELSIDKDFNVGEDGIEQISLAVIDLNRDQPLIGGVNADNFIYPASVYKIYIAAEVLNQISQELYDLDHAIIVRAPNDVDRLKEVENDPRPLLRTGDTVTVNYLLDLMLTRSDNSAANCLIDLAKRENINALIHKYNWHGSEVTRKFLSRKFEDPGYEKIRGTETSALHTVEFLYLLNSNKLVNSWVSQQLKTFLGRQLDNTKLSQGLPQNTMFYHKTGWYSFWTHDVGIVDDGKIKYIIACFLPIRQETALPIFNLLSKNIHNYLTNRNKKKTK